MGTTTYIWQFDDCYGGKAFSTYPPLPPSVTFDGEDEENRIKEFKLLQKLYGEPTHVRVIATPGNPREWTFDGKQMPIEQYDAQCEAAYARRLEEMRAADAALEEKERAASEKRAAAYSRWGWAYMSGHTNTPPPEYLRK